MFESGPQTPAAHPVESLRQLAMTNLQLLAMLEVVHGWTSADANELIGVAEQTLALSARLRAGGEGDTDRDETSTAPRANLNAVDDPRIVRAIEQTRTKIHRLSQLALGQSRDAASAAAVIEALQHLQRACEALHQAAGLDAEASTLTEAPAYRSDSLA